MSTLVFPMSSPRSLKRTFEETEMGSSLAHSSARQSPPLPASEALSNDEARTVHSSLSSQPVPLAASVSGEQHASASLHTTMDDGAASSTATNKKSKLTFAERELKRIEKEFKDQQKAEERAKKEEERILREEEKRKREEEKAREKRTRDAEREEKRKAKEEKDRSREEEKAKREEEKSKKAKVGHLDLTALLILTENQSQLRLNAFFGQTQGPTRSSTASPTREGHSPLSSRRSSIAEIDATGKRLDISASLTPQRIKASDYERAFPPFFVQSHTFLAPFNRFVRDDRAIFHAESKIDQVLNQGLNIGEKTPGSYLPILLHFAPLKKRRWYRSTPTVKQIIARINGSSQEPIDLTDSKTFTRKPTDLLQSISMKTLKFAEDVRPPYIGTYTKSNNRETTTKLPRKPCSRLLPEVNYDYDSEAEWEDPGEGEDLDSEGEEEADDEDEDEMDGFLDDEEVADSRTVKRRPLLGDLEPTCTGLCWPGDRNGPDLSAYCIDTLTGKKTSCGTCFCHADNTTEVQCFPIDPYTTSYWHEPPPAKAAQSSIPAAQSSLMEPPRIPLNQIHATNTLLLPNQQPLKSGKNPPHPNPNQSNPSTDTLNNVKTPKRLIPNDLIDDFKSAIKGSDLTKIGLVEVLKKQFPKQSKDVLRDSLDMVAERVGEKLAEKRWVLRPGV